jgi:hypothetical protein
MVSAPVPWSVNGTYHDEYATELQIRDISKSITRYANNKDDESEEIPEYIQLRSSRISRLDNRVYLMQ